MEEKTSCAEFERMVTQGLIAGGVDAARIDALESELGVRLPLAYRHFLARHGAALAHGMPIYGIAKAQNDQPPLWQNVADVSRQLREMGQAGTERALLLPISDDGMGSYFFLDTSDLSKAPIWVVGPWADRLVSEDFHDFFVKAMTHGPSI